LSEPVVIVSGGSRGLGLAIVCRLLEIGYRVGTFSRSRTKEIDELCSDDRWANQLLYESVDMSDLSVVREFVAKTHHEFDRIDALVNNAAIATDSVLAMITDAQIRQMVDVNVGATLALTRECIRFMLLGDQGHIINISSIVAQRGFSGLSAYAATKAAMEGMTKSLARELGKRKIRVNTLAPGFLETDMSASLTDDQRRQIVRRTPLGRLGRSIDVVPWIEFLLSEQSGFVTGQTITIDGGASL